MSPSDEDSGTRSDRAIYPAKQPLIHIGQLSKSHFDSNVYFWEKSSLKRLESMKTSLQNQARWAGFFFLLNALTTFYGLLYIRGELVFLKDANATAKAILENQQLFRIGIFSIFFAQVFALIYNYLIYGIFKNVHSTIAHVFMASAVISSILAVANLGTNLGALSLLYKADYFQVFTEPQRNALLLWILRISNDMQGIMEIFWAPRLICFGLLILKSDYIPKVFAYLLFWSSIWFPVNTINALLFPEFRWVVLFQITVISAALGNLPILFWLLIKGVRVR
jgi:Domain of unknown function (DUF4386)